MKNKKRLWKVWRWTCGRPTSGRPWRPCPRRKRKIAFDKFHVAKHLGEAVDRVRRGEHRDLSAQGDDTLKGSKYLWLWNPENMSAEKWRGFKALRESALKTARAWAIKETAMGLWHYVSRGWAETRLAGMAGVGATQPPGTGSQRWRG